MIYSTIDNGIKYALEVFNRCGQKKRKYKKSSAITTRKRTMHK